MSEQGQLRFCGICGESLERRDPRTEVCSRRCRIERSRTRRLMLGKHPGPWPSLAAYNQRERMPQRAIR